MYIQLTFDQIPVYHWGQSWTLHSSRWGGIRFGHRWRDTCKKMHILKFKTLLDMIRRPIDNSLNIISPHFKSVLIFKEKMKVFALALLTFVLVNNATGAQKQYNGWVKSMPCPLINDFRTRQFRQLHRYRVLKTSPLDNDQAWAVRELQASNNRLDFWKEAQVGASAEIMVHQDLLNGLNEFMALNNIKYTVMIEDVEEWALSF